MTIVDKPVRMILLMQIPWNDDEELLAAWREARTGYPWIDAIMVQVLIAIILLLSLLVYSCFHVEAEHLKSIHI